MQSAGLKSAEIDEQIFIIMNLRRLRYFVVVADELHFGRAAQRLHVAQPALTQNVQALEAEFNVELLARSSRRVELTEAGAVLFVEAKRLLELADQVRHRMNAFVLGREGTVRLNFARSAAGGASSAIVEMLRNEAPALQLQINSQYTAKSIEDLLDGKLDAAFVRSPLELADPAVRQLQVLPIGSEPLVVGLPRTHRLTRRQRIHAADLADEPIVTGSAERAPGFYRMMFGQIWGDRSPRIVLHEPDEEHMLRAVAAGTGLTILTESRAKAIQVQASPYAGSRHRNRKRGWRWCGLRATSTRHLPCWSTSRIGSSRSTPPDRAAPRQGARPPFVHGLH